MCIYLYQGWDLDWALRKGSQETVELNQSWREEETEGRGWYVMSVAEEGSPSQVGDTLGIPTELTSLLTNAGLETVVI